MTQEKQKVIRVLQPTKKPTKSSPKLIGLSVVAVGLIAVATLFFTFSPFSTNNLAIDQTIDTDTENKNINKDAKNEGALLSNQNQEDASADGDVIHPQPKLNEITNIFKRQKEVAVVDTPTNTGNPFDSMLNAGNSNPLPVLEKKSNIPNANNTHKPEANATTKSTTLSKEKEQNTATDKVKDEKNLPKSEPAKPPEVKQAQKVETPVTAQNSTTAKE